MIDPVEKVILLKKEFEGASDRAVAIVAGAFLDELLTEILREFFVGDTASDKKILEGTGFLATFSSKIEIAFRLGLISKQECKTLHTIRSIRNMFAHELSEISFRTHSISDRCKNIETNVEMIAPEIIPLSQKGEQPPLPQIVKANSGDSRGLFQETIITLMHVLAARFCHAASNKRHIPTEFSQAHEPGVTILEHIKEAADRIQQLQAEYKILAASKGISIRDEEEDQKTLEKDRLLIRVQEFCINQIKAAHAKHKHDLERNGA